MPSERPTCEACWGLIDIPCGEPATHVAGVVRDCGCRPPTTKHYCPHHAEHFGAPGPHWCRYCDRPTVRVIEPTRLRVRA